MTHQNVTTQQADERKSLSKELEILQPELEKVLPAHVTPEKFMRVVMTALANDPELQRSDRRALLNACVRCAQDGLVPDGREAALVLFSGKAQYMPMVYGIMKKIRNSGELHSLSTNVVYHGDEFRYWVDDLGEHILHEPDLTGDRGEFKLVYAIAKTKDGGVYVEVMSKAQVDQVRDVSRAKNAGPWRIWYDEMSRKTVLRRLSKRLPMSTDIERVIRADDQFYDMDKQVPARSGVDAAKRVLLPQLPDAPEPDPEPEPQEKEETVDTDTGEVLEQPDEPAHIPQFDEAVAIKSLESKRTVKTLEELFSQIVEDFTKTQREIPLSIEAKYQELHEALTEKEKQL